MNLTGGEPFLRSDLVEIAEFIRENTDTYLLNLTTNGLLGDRVFRMAKKIADLNFPKFVLVVSLDGPRKIHDYIRGVKGNWYKSVRLYKKLRDLSKKRPGFQTFFGYTISQYNLGKIEDTIKEVDDEIGNVSIDNFHFNIFHVSSLYYGNRGEYVGDLKQKILRDVDFVLKNKGGFGPIPFLERKYLKLIKGYYETGKSPIPCKALTSSCFIDPWGNVFPCTHWERKLGSLRENGYDLKEIWKSKLSEKTRELIKQNKCPGCWTPCEAYQTIIGNVLRK